MERPAGVEPDVVRLRPYKPWCYIVGDNVAPIKCRPKVLTAAIAAGRNRQSTIDVLVSVIETAKAMNRMMGKPEHEGVT